MFSELMSTSGTFSPYSNPVFHITLFVINVNPPPHFQEAVEKPASPLQAPMAETKQEKADNIFDYTGSQ